MSIENIETYVSSFGMFGEPVEYKQLKLYPILTQDLTMFNNNRDILDINKNKLGSIEFIQMSYLMFLLNLIQMDKGAMKAFLWLMSKVLRINCSDSLIVDGYDVGTLLINSDSNEDKRIYIVNGWEIAFEVVGNRASLFIGDVKINATEFDEFRKIIFYQNIMGYDDTILSDDVQRVMNQYYTLKNKGIKLPTEEDKMLAILVSSSETRESLRTMPCKQFEKLFNMAKDKTEYMVSVPLIPHLKNSNVEHWIYKKEHNKFDGIFKDAENVGKRVVK